MLFARAIFDAGCSFRKTCFPPMVKFERNQFEGPADFSAVRLGSKFTRFDTCVFEGGVDLSGMTGDAAAKLLFIECQFGGPVAGTKLAPNIVFTSTDNVPVEALLVLSPEEDSTAHPISGNIEVTIADAPFNGTIYRSKT